MRIRFPKIPYEYQEVEYIASANGYQYIDTGYIPSYTQGFEISFEFAATATGKHYCLLSNYNQGQAQLSLELTAANQVRYWLNYGNLDKKVGTFAANTKYTATYKYSPGSYYFALNTTADQGSYATPGNAPNYSMYLFVDRALRYSTFNTPLKIYSCKIIQNGAVVRNFVPCYLKATPTRIGLYDTANGRFYENIGSGSFTKGNDVAAVGLRGKIGYYHIPQEYQGLEYISSSGAQRVVLDITPSSKSKIIETFSMNAINTTSCLWCARGGTTGTNSTTAFYIANSQIRCDYGTSATMTGIDSLTVNTKHTLMMNAQDWYLDWVKKTSMSTATFNAGGPLTLFASYYNGTSSNIDNYAKIKLYEFKMYGSTNQANAVLTCDLVPCYRKADGVVGLYDRVSDTFYSNIGSGAFEKGPEIKYTSWQVN